MSSSRGLFRYYSMFTVSLRKTTKISARIAAIGEKRFKFVTAECEADLSFSLGVTRVIKLWRIKGFGPVACGMWGGVQASGVHRRE
jgi:hypothetical protein